MAQESIDRRSFLKATGGAAAGMAVTTGSAGCLGMGGDGGGGDLVYARGDHPTNYDPQQTTSGEVAKVTNQIYDQLIKFGAGSGGALVEGLATDWSLDGQTATLTLREGVTFHNGAELTASDVRATVRRFTDSEYDYYLGDSNRSGYGAFTFGDWVESVDDSGDLEVTFELTQQFAPFLRNLAMFAAAILSQQQIEDLGASPDEQTALGEEPQGTGAFTFDTLDNENQRVKLAANDDFWGEGPQVDAVIFKTIQQNSTRVQDVINGDSHITDNLDSQSSTQVEDADSASLASKNGINVGYMAFNMDRKEEFRDRQVRQAISYAVDTESIVSDIYEGFAEQADQPLPPDVLGYNEELDPYAHDPEQAQSLLEEAGASDLSFELATFSNPRGYNPSPVETANQVRSDLEEVGVTVEINQFSTFSSYLEYTDAGNHDACFLGWYTDNADPDNFLYVLLDPKVEMDQVPDGQDWVGFDTDGYSPLNAAAWANTEFMETVREAQSSYEEGSREELYKEANAIAHEEAPWVFIDYAETLRAVNEAVVGDSYTVSSVGGPHLNTVELQ
ncbi:ABC transporter substrate-binding protein [Halorarum salinum]|uniref:ABC transporter substrate-binding protein n=1 Tax=Halorarum salinum TaxID=2743089 RepID=A0A7D5L9D9_9EURY|nr:ABC transporter substrate-binding protein [Halobaculum salinum]QLG60775.1 ABC transporter substrate-binding protein [Halobaculum salinum]